MYPKRVKNLPAAMMNLLCWTSGTRVNTVYRLFYGCWHHKFVHMQPLTFPLFIHTLFSFHLIHILLVYQNKCVMFSYKMLIFFILFYCCNKCRVSVHFHGIWMPHVGLWLNLKFEKETENIYH